MKILITGGSGFIGTNLVEYYLNLGYEVLSLDKTPPKISLHEKVFRSVDIRKIDDLRREVAKFAPHFLIHMAADTGLTGESLNDYDTNLLGVENILKISNETKSIKKVIFASTMLVCKAGHIPQRDNEYSATTLYGQSKALAEEMVRNFGLDCHWAIVRPSSIWGPWFGRTYREFFELIIAKKYFNFSGKMSIKTYGYIDNVVYQINEILFSEKSNGQTLYLGDYEPTDIKIWAKEISLILSQNVYQIPKFIVFLAAKFGDLILKFKIRFPLNSFRLSNMTTDNILDLNKTKKIAPNLPFNRIEGTKKTLDWMVSQRLAK